MKCLLIGGQACIIYGAVEFSRDSDFVIFSDAQNIHRLQEALASLKAEPIYVPELDIDFLEKGHACHFRCQDEEVKGLRVDILSKLRGCDAFELLWTRRKTIVVEGFGEIDIIGLKDLVRSKKTQRDKDWFMINRLVENDFFLNRNNSSKEQIAWWLTESRTPDHLVYLAKKYPEIFDKVKDERLLLKYAHEDQIEKLSQSLIEEERVERQKDIEYWAPLRKELEIFRHKSARENK